MSSGFHTLRKAKRKTPVFNYQPRKEKKLLTEGEELFLYICSIWIGSTRRGMPLFMPFFMPLGRLKNDFSL
jgi:hypothetical protein|uniref:Uncharacterized protein n=1 Tax=Picea glauca TaxID=3330 RepID=A0A101LVN7_PICGL|nr:hypothetical protein ABT39_MTgene1991 [Picea glauca]QHR87475.1 hypothetical protein Q903MT_gene1486 [Picea sitchensis]